jgi:MoxR-like ATPase
MFDLEAEESIGKSFRITEEVTRAVNASLILRRPLLVTGKPGVGKSSLASAVAYELRMGPVLRWPITSRSTVKGGLYDYDAVGRLQAGGESVPIGDFLRLGPLGSALYPTCWPRVLLIDEIDKGDIDFPNDLLNILEEGYFEIPELARAREEVVDVRLHNSKEGVRIVMGEIKCQQFPFVVLTSNGEREFPPPFLRRCIRITIPQPTSRELAEIVESHLLTYLTDKKVHNEMLALVTRFVALRQEQELATDQLLNAVFVVLGDGRFSSEDPIKEEMITLLLKQLSTQQAT